jgi:glycosyltransferase involved in cell wall biosynthesis
VVLERWPVAQPIQHDALTTIAHWRGYGSIDFQGVTYGQKVHSLRQFITLPTLTVEPFCLALAIHPGETKDLAALAAHRWRLLDPASVANTPARYQEFIQGSKAEFGIAKSGYVHSRCAWFSDRSLCYLASGRPVIAQDCGLGGLLPVGEGLLTFTTPAEVLNAIDSLNADYLRHARRAREIAAEIFDSDRVLTRLLGLVGL